MTLLFHINKSDADMTMEYSISRLRLFTQSQWDVIIEFLKAVRDWADDDESIWEALNECSTRALIQYAKNSAPTS